MMPEQLNKRFKDVIVEMRENGFRFTSVPENKLDKVVFHSVRAASATKKLQVSNGNVKAVMRAGGWAEPDMVIRYSRAYDQDQVDIAEKMETPKFPRILKHYSRKFWTIRRFSASLLSS